MKAGIDMAKFATKKLRETFWQAVAMRGEICETTLLEDGVRRIAEEVAVTMWKAGYKPEDFKHRIKEMDYGNNFVIGVKVEGYGGSETVRQFCYQFVELADAYRIEYEELMKKVKSSLIMRLIFWMKGY